MLARSSNWRARTPSQRFTRMCRKRRSKADWAGVGIEDAFKNNLNYYLRLTAQRLFYQAVKEAQVTVARLAEGATGSEFRPAVKPQLGPCYTTYPSVLSAHAGVGLTAFLEFKARSRERILFLYLKGYLKNPAQIDRFAGDPKVYKQVAGIVTECVETRLLLEDLSRLPSLSAVEIYRLFSASQQTLRFSSLREIIWAVILYGDVLPDRRLLNLHPLTRSLLRELTGTSVPFFSKLPLVKPLDLPEFGVNWVQTVCRCLSPYLLKMKGESKEKKMTEKGGNMKDIKKLWKDTGDEELERFPDETLSNGETDKIAPLDRATPPFVSDPPSAKEQLLGNLADGVKKSKKDIKAFGQFSAAIKEASVQNRSWEDMRSDLVERALRMGVFGESPIQGNPAEGHEVKMTLREGLEAGGEIFDRPVPLSHNLPAYEKLLEESLPVIEALRRSLYPNIEEVPETERLRTGGSLDPARLALAEFSSVIFRRYRIRERADPRGCPVLVIACDGSGSLNRYQMKMLKIMACGWLNSTVRSHIQVLAGLYHSGHVRRGVSGPLVQWIYHPQKTPALSRQDAARSLVSLSDGGTGVQSDALSLSFITEEARRIAKGGMIYLIVLSDTEWNRSFHTHMEGEEEVYSFFKRAYEQLPGKLHATLVALGVSGETGFENLLDKVITVASSELEDQSKVAEKIGLYVASCMRERRRSHAKGWG